MIDCETKEFYIEKIIKYNAELSDQNRTITLTCVTIGLVAIYSVLNIIRSGTLIELPITFLHLAMTSVLLGSTALLIENIAGKIGIKAKVKEIEELFVYYGLTLHDEVAKVRRK